MDFCGVLILRQLKQRSKHPKPAKTSPLPTPIQPAPALTSRRKWLFRLIALVLVPVLALAGLELVLRLSGCGYPTSLFKNIRIGGKEFVAINEDFSLRFFPPALARWPNPIMMEAKKPADTCRIFIFGESAAEGDPHPAYSAARYMEILLRERFPGEKFEVINLGITAIDSHVIVPMARECARQHGDIWIVYMGNNEMIGPFGASTVFGAQTPPLAFVRLNLAIQKTRVGQLMMSLARKMRGETSNALWGSMQMFVGNNVSADDPRREMVCRNFKGNLEDIVHAGLGSGAKILLNTVAVNLKDCPPFASLHSAHLSAADRATFDRLYAEGSQAESRGGFKEAAQLYEQAAQLDPRFADLQYHWANCLLQLAQFTAARQHFQSACDFDALSFRTDSRLNDLIRQAGKANAGPGLVLFNAAAALETNSPTGICGQETFYEHVHFNFDGDYRLGRDWAAQVETLLPAAVRSRAASDWASQEICERRLGLTDVNRVLSIRLVNHLLSVPPLSSQPNNTGRLKAYEDEEAKLRLRLDTNALARAREVYIQATNRAPEDYWLHENFARFFEVTRDLKQATAEWRCLYELMPCNMTACLEAGRLLAQQGLWTEAETSLRQAVAIYPNYTDAWRELGGLYVAEGKLALALKPYDRVRRNQPGDPHIYCQIGSALLRLGRSAEAMDNFHHALRLQPDDSEAHYALGIQFGLAGNNQEAQAEFEQVIRLQPDNARAHLNLGVMLGRQGQLDGALQQFEETLRLDPGNKEAQNYRDQILSRNARKR